MLACLYCSGMLFWVWTIFLCDSLASVLYTCSARSALVHTLGPCETMYYTWDNPLDRRALRWGLAGARTRDPNLIYVDKVRVQLDWATFVSITDHSGLAVSPDIPRGWATVVSLSDYFHLIDRL